MTPLLIQVQPDQARLERVRSGGREQTMRVGSQRCGWLGYPALGAAAIAAAAITACGYWPGLMTWDAVRQYREALSGDITDWHPPVMQWVWRQLIPLHRGPAPMLLLQLSLYWGGLTLLAASRWRRGRPGVAWAVLACGLFPLGFALTGAVLKDCLMAGTLLVAAGLLGWRDVHGGLWRTAAAVALLIFAATLRFNAFAACLPFLIVLLPPAWHRGWPRLLATGLCATAMLMAAMPLANRLIGAAPTDVALSLIIFDLGGITEHSGVDVFPSELAVDDAVRVNHRCYRSDKWDSYSDWVAPECPLGFSAWTDDAISAELHPYSTWAHAIAAHPLAYAAHRLNHFAINTRLVPLPDAVERPVQKEDAPNPWGQHLVPNPVLRGIDALAVGAAHTPLGWPIVWIALALGGLVAGNKMPAAALIMPLAASSLLYGCSYLVFSVAAELRYQLWTGLAALIATILVLAERTAISPRRLAFAYVPSVLAILAALATRI